MAAVTRQDGRAFAVAVAVTIAAAVAAHAACVTSAGGATPWVERGPATAARFAALGAIAAAEGALLVADAGAHRIWRVHAANASITHVAGSGVAGFFDARDARHAAFNGPAAAVSAVAWLGGGGDGGVLVADAGNHRVRAIATNFSCWTVAGDGAGRSSGDGGDARAASLNFPVAVAVHAGSGDVLIGESAGCRIRRVFARNGTIATVLGRAACGGAGNEVGPAGLIPLYRSVVSLLAFAAPTTRAAHLRWQPVLVRAPELVRRWLPSWACRRLSLASIRTPPSLPHAARTM